MELDQPLYFLPLRFYLVAIPLAAAACLPARLRWAALPLLAWLCGYLAVEWWFRLAPLTLPLPAAPLLVPLVEHLNTGFLHRLHQVLGLAIMGVMLRSCSQLIRVGDLTTRTDILGKDRPWRAVVERFLAYLAGALILLALANPAPWRGSDALILVPVLLAALTNSLIEEIIFRGYLLAAFREHIGPSRANLLQAVLFGLIHYPSFDLTHYILKVVVFTFLGWFFGRAAMETQGLGASTLMHTGVVLAVEMRLRFAG